jgi:multicomponent Na+:H+ antiporter subunit B
VADLYLREAMPETSVPNIVTAVLASYRGYDTMGETTVILTAGVGVMVVLGFGRNSRRNRKDEDAA